MTEFSTYEPEILCGEPQVNCEQWPVCFQFHVDNVYVCAALYKALHNIKEIQE